MIDKLYFDNDLNKIFNQINKRKSISNTDIEKTVQCIVNDVMENGDDALKKYAKKFDGFEIKDMRDIMVSKEEIESGAQNVGDDFIRILNRTKDQIVEFHKNQINKSWSIMKENGVIMGQIVRPLKRVAVYVPGGTACYPSTVLMNIIPAKIAGVEEIIMLTPVKSNGKVADVILAAAKVCGIEKIYKIGGAQAIAAAAYGTDTIPKVDKIVGPGNIFVATAKKCCYGVVDIDMIAGPSEILIVADATANARYIAADMMSQAEHDKLACSILITDDEKQANNVNKEVKRQIRRMLRKDIIKYSLSNYGMIIIVKNLDDAFMIANEIAPEHIEVLTKEAISMLPKVKNAGSIFLGEYTPEALGDYMSGTNHVLPTLGTAKFNSALGVYEFIKYSSYSYYPKNILKTFKDDIAKFAFLEGLEAHANSIKIRFEEENDDAT